MEFAGKIKAPVGHALRGKEWIQYDNPYDVGMSGLLGYGAAYEATHECDLLILLGTDFPYNAFLPGDDVKIVQVDVRPEIIGRRSKLDLAVWGDVKETLRCLTPRVRTKDNRKFLDRMLKKHAEALEGVVKAYTRKVEKHVPIHPEYVASVLDDLADDDAVFTVDTGMCNVWAARYISPNGRRRIIGSFSHGSMANALPMAIGAQFTDRHRQVVSMSGDGGFAMLMGDFLTLVQYDLPVKVVLFNNSSLGMVELEMLVAGLPSYGTAMKNPDFAAVARACGAYGARVEKPKELAGALKAAFKHKEGAGGRRDRPQRAVDPAEDQQGDGDRVRPVGVQDRAGRRGRPDAPDGPLQPAQRAAPVRAFNPCGSARSGSGCRTRSAAGPRRRWCGRGGPGRRSAPVAGAALRGPVQLQVPAAVAALGAGGDHQHLGVGRGHPVRHPHRRDRLARVVPGDRAGDRPVLVQVHVEVAWRQRAAAALVHRVRVAGRGRRTERPPARAGP